MLDPVNVKPAVEVKAEPAPKQPDGANHNLVISEGGQSRVVTFLLDRTGRVLNGPSDVTRTELPPAKNDDR